MKFSNKILILLLLSVETVVSIEPITTTLGSLLGAFAISVLYSSWDYLKCSSNECCHRINENKAIVKGEGVFEFNRKPWIDYNLEQLEHSLNTEVYGQHLMKNMIPKLIRKHLNDLNPKKALVLSFHGWTGGGKNFVSQIVAKSIFRKHRESQNSDFVHLLIGTNFLNRNLSRSEIENQIESEVINGVKKCERSLFIFDEIDKLPPGVIDVIKPFLDYHPFIDGIDYKKAIFIFLSNTGGTGITKLTHDFYLSGKERKDLTIKDLEPLISSGAFNERGGLHKSDIIEKNLINAFVPFLPLEKKHIELCIIDYLKQRYNKPDPTKDPGIKFIKEVANEMQYFPTDTKLYSKTGCKRVATKVDVLI